MIIIFHFMQLFLLEHNDFISGKYFVTLYDDSMREYYKF